MNNWRIAASVGLIMLHFLLHVGLGLGPAAPDLATLGVLVLARETGFVAGAVTGFVAGLLEDALNVLSFGSATLALTLVGAAGARSRELFVGDSKLFVVAYIGVGKWGRDAVQWFATTEPLRDPLVSSLLVESVIGALYLALLALALRPLVRPATQSEAGVAQGAAR